MGSAEIPSLLLAVRRHLWRQRAGDAVRVALWSTAALLLAAVAKKKTNEEKEKKININKTTKKSKTKK